MMRMIWRNEKLVLVLALVGLELAQWVHSRPYSVALETVLNPAGSGVANSTTILVSRQEEDDEDDDDSGGVDEDTQKRISQGVGNILLGAFSLDPNRIIQGAFGFADKDVRENILNVILGHKPPGAEKDTGTKSSASTTEKALTSAQSTKTNVNRDPAPTKVNLPNSNKPNEPAQSKSQEIARKIITTTTTQPATTRKVRKTTVYVPEDDEEADLRY